MKKVIVLLAFIAFVFFIYSIRDKFEDALDFSSDEFYNHDDFKKLDEDFWYVGEWKTFDKVTNKVNVDDGILTMEVSETDKGPIMFSKPIEVKEGQVIKISRRAKIHYANDFFTGGLALIETNEISLRPFIEENYGKSGIGFAVALVEYVHNYDEQVVRPGKDTFRLLPPNWMENSNYKLIDPIFDDWFTEELTYDPETGRITYKLNEDEYTLEGLPMDEKNIRVMMHPYGMYTGHSIKIDWFEISIK
jgi:hypothetical protein